MVTRNGVLQQCFDECVSDRCSAKDIAMKRCGCDSRLQGCSLPRRRSARLLPPPLAAKGKVPRPVWVRDHGAEHYPNPRRCLLSSSRKQTQLGASSAYLAFSQHLYRLRLAAAIAIQHVAQPICKPRWISYAQDCGSSPFCTNHPFRLPILIEQFPGLSKLREKRIQYYQYSVLNKLVQSATSNTRQIR